MCHNKAKMIPRLFVHCFIPLAIGFIIYLLFHEPNLMLHSWLYSLAPIPNFYTAIKGHPIIIFLLNHLPDILWNYSLTHFLLIFISNALPPFSKAAIIVFIVSLSEIIQVFYPKQFTFDWIDLALAIIITFFVLNTHKYEK
jgi:hypothetical protein